LIALAPIFFGACSRDIFDVDVDLASHAFSADFGTQGGTIPVLECDPAAPDVCGAGQIVTVSAEGEIPATVNVQIGCDGTSRRCFAQADATASYELSVLTDEDFVTKVERRAVSFVRVVDIAYALPVNTLTFDLPSIDVYVGPAGSRAVTDSGVVLMDTVQGVTAGQTITDTSRHLVVADQSPARDLLESSIRAQEPFVFLVQAAPRLEAGSPVPSGRFELVLYPRITVGLPP
jgi:hypothetical protein